MYSFSGILSPIASNWRGPFVLLTVGAMLATTDAVPFTAFAGDDGDRKDGRHFHTRSHYFSGFLQNDDGYDDDHDDEDDPKHFRPKFFRRIATFPVFMNHDIGTKTVSEIVDASKDGKTLLYTDSANKEIGFVNIQNPYDPQPAGVLGVGGEPTSVAVAYTYALAAVDTSNGNFIDPSGHLHAIDIKKQTIVETFDLDGQPDSVAVSPDKQYAVVVIENQRDEDNGPNGGVPPQLPSGFVWVFTLDGPPSNWTKIKVDLAGVADLFSEDAEPEFVDINRNNIAAVTLQENNHIVLIDLNTSPPSIIKDFSAGTVQLTQIDNDDNKLIELTGSYSGPQPREPDAIVWISDHTFATADEGDLEDGGRGFTIYDTHGNEKFTAGNAFEHLLVRAGHYPDKRSDSRGNEPEAVEFGNYHHGKDKFLFVGSERSGVVGVYRVNGYGQLRFVQLLSTGVRPEGLKAIPERNLLVTASEEDERGDKFRSVITIYQLVKGKPNYPTIVSTNREDGTPIPWGALGALASDPHQQYPKRIFTAHDRFYHHSRIYEMDVRGFPAKIIREIELLYQGQPQNYDIEGLAVRPCGKGFWAVSEGAGGVSDLPIATPNLLLKIAPDGTVLKEIMLPPAAAAKQERFGLKGVTSVYDSNSNGEVVYVAFQREWAGDPDDHVRIGRYDTQSQSWTFLYYELDQPISPNGGWVGLSEIVALDHETFLVVERDNQAGADAAIKKIYKFSINGLTPQPDGQTFPIIAVGDKTLVRDLIPVLEATKGAVLEKVEGLTVTAKGDMWIVTDNDGVDDSNGETQLINLGRLK